MQMKVARYINRLKQPELQSLPITRNPLVTMVNRKVKVKESWIEEVSIRLNRCEIAITELVEKIDSLGREKND